MKAAWNQFWQQRTPRERAILFAGAAVLGVGFVYAYLWLPLERDHARLSADVPRLRNEAQQMRDDAREIESMRARAKAPPADLKAALSAAAAGQKGVAPPQISAEADGGLRVVFPSVRFDDWVSWLAATSAYGVRLATVRVEPLDTPGLVKASATFSAGAK